MLQTQSKSSTNSPKSINVFLSTTPLLLITAICIYVKDSFLLFDTFPIEPHNFYKKKKKKKNVFENRSLC